MAQSLDEIAAEYRRQLLTLEQKSTEAFDKAVLSLSGGALGLSIAFFEQQHRSKQGRTDRISFRSLDFLGL